MKAQDASDQKDLMREEVIREIQQLAADLGHNPKKSELPSELHSKIRSVFGKWCYAQEAAGLVVPSERVQEKRRKREAHKAKVAERQQKREQEKKAKDLEKQKLAGKKKKDTHVIQTYHAPDTK